ncbi:MAG: tyrosine--tRNA ligase [Candidatus Aenigmarchaeota archaeon]|nr:tyrosine--tRNA ligase [Candidatus Aenigmarchaeota archaeon]
MDVEKRFELVSQVGEGGEIVTPEELKALLAEKKHPIAYDGFEPSGHVHIAQGLLRAININKMTSAGCKFKMLVADWHGWANNKMGGNLENIQTVGKYLIEVWKSCGLDADNVEFVWASGHVKDDDYWKKVMQVARNTTVNRIVRCGQIMGRKDADVQQASQILYPCMQAADIFHLKADICQLGLDQRKVNVLAREIGPKLGYWKPVIVSHHMMMGLVEPVVSLRYSLDLDIYNKASRFKYYREADEFFLEDVVDKQKFFIKKNISEYNYPDGSKIKILYDKLFPGSIKIEHVISATERAIDMKMSKSKPDSAIFMTDSPEEVKRKISKAYCPEKQIAENPILEYCKFIIFEKFKTFDIKRHEKFGGDVSFESYAGLEKAYAEGKIHPMDLKSGVALRLNELLEPVRQHFEKNAKAKDLLEAVNKLEVTR